MIVTHFDQSTLRMIHQPDHAALSQQLAARWRRPQTIPETIWPRFVWATGHHDDGWQVAERKPTLDEHGRPHTFKSVPTDEHAAIWRRSIATLTEQDAYAGLLVALHARWLYTNISSGRNHDAGEANALVDELDQRVDALLPGLRKEGPAMRAVLEPDVLNTARRLLGLFDAMSLMLVGGLKVGDFPEPVAFGDQVAALRLTALDEGLAVSPWPFEGRAFELSAEAYHVPDRAYGDAPELVRAMAARPAEQLQCRIAPG